jgi:hypothetical protein
MIDSDPAKTATRQAMILCLEGLMAYSANLARQADQEAASTEDPVAQSRARQAGPHL